MRTLMPLLDAAQNRRHAAAGAGADLDAAQQRVAKAMQATAQVQARLGATLRTY